MNGNLSGLSSDGFGAGVGNQGMSFGLGGPSAIQATGPSLSGLPNDGMGGGDDGGGKQFRVGAGAGRTQRLSPEAQYALGPRPNMKLVAILRDATPLAIGRHIQSLLTANWEGDGYAVLGHDSKVLASPWLLEGLAAVAELPEAAFRTHPTPKIIHQTWKTRDIPASCAAFQRSLQDLHPHWEYKLHTDADNYALIRDSYPWFLPFYEAYPHHIQRVDAARYFWLYHEGGLYADLDMQCLSPMDSLLEQASGVIVGHEGEMHYNGTQRIGNAVLASPPGHPFLKRVFEGLMKLFVLSDPERHQSVFLTTGPSFLHEVFTRWPHDVTDMPSSAFYPRNWTANPDLKLVNKRQCPRSWMCHHWLGSWRQAPRHYRLLWTNGDDAMQAVTVAAERKRQQGFGPIEQHLHQGLWFRQKLLDAWKNVVQPGSHVVHVGAYNGYLVVPLATMVAPTGKVFAFEPCVSHHALLLDTLAANPSIEPLVQPFGDMPYSQKTALHRVNKPNPMKPQVVVWRASQNGNETCVGMPLDAVLWEQRIDVLDITAHGEEYAVLAGAATTIQQFQPAITIQIWPDNVRQEYQCPLRAEQTFYMLQKLEYDIFPLAEHFTYVCLPKESAAPAAPPPHPQHSQHSQQPQHRQQHSQTTASYSRPLPPPPPPLPPAVRQPPSEMSRHHRR